MDSKIKCLRSNNGGDLTSNEFMDYYNRHGIERQFFVARTPQHNAFVERKNMTIQEMDRTMIMDSKLIDIFWTHAVHTTIHIQNRVMLRKGSADNNLYTKVTQDGILLIEVYVDDIIFGGIDEVLMTG